MSDQGLVMKCADPIGMMIDEASACWWDPNSRGLHAEYRGLVDLRELRRLRL